MNTWCWSEQTSVEYRVSILSSAYFSERRVFTTGSSQNHTLIEEILPLHMVLPQTLPSFHDEQDYVPALIAVVVKYSPIHSITSPTAAAPKPPIEVDINATDSLGRTAVHHLMKTCDFGTYENVEILKKLAGKRAKLVAQDHQGKTPLDYTMETKSKKMATALQELLKVNPRQRVSRDFLPFV